LVAKWIYPIRSETAELGQKIEGILGVNFDAWDKTSTVFILGFGVSNY
jgi:hypothetical protein